MKIFKWFICLMFGLVLGSASLMLVASPWGLTVLYAGQELDASALGFNQQERFQLASSSLIVIDPMYDKPAITTHLSSLKSTNNKSLYTLAEIEHLIDVRTLLFSIYKASSICVIWLVAIFIVRIRTGGLQSFYKLLKSTTRNLGITLATILLSLTFFWEKFFLYFHLLFFPQGNWSFEADSGLISLFPETFWFRFGVFWILLVLGINTAFWIVATKLDSGS